MGVSHLHEQGIIHRDLKLENVLVTMDGQVVKDVKIVDLGLSCTIESFFQGIAGT